MTKKRIVSQSSYVDPSKAGKKAAQGTNRVYRGTFEAEWTCNSCGREHIPGRIKKCPSCGNPKDYSEEYQAPEQTGAYLSDQELKEMGVDPNLHLSDEVCPYCGAKNKPGTPKCVNCGAPLEDVGYITRQCPACGTETNAEICPSCGAQTVPKEEKPPESPHPVGVQPTPTSQSLLDKYPFLKNTWVIVGVIISILALLICCIVMFIPRTETAIVDDIYWERTIGIQEHQYNQHEDWDLPAGTDLDHQEQKIHHYDKVLRGYEEECGYEDECTSVSVYDHTEKTCYDDGTCDEHDVYRTEQECTQEYVCEDVPVYDDVPVYQTWYTYHIWEWVDLEPVRASAHNANLQWPILNLDDNQREKPNSRQESCTVIFVNKKEKSFEYTPSCADLANYDIGSHWEIKRSAMAIKEVNPVK
ncbi:MAG: hypothetical protein JXA33_05660 [Anaerolineae bacterium]|nr:hypothetical protein [Anaerolineae bacterium]